MRIATLLLSALALAAITVAMGATSLSMFQGGQLLAGVVAFLIAASTAYWTVVFAKAAVRPLFRRQLIPVTH